MTAVEELDGALAQLHEEQPRLLTRTPGPGGELPYAISLAAWGTEAAAALHERFGDDVELTVGFLPYPPGRPSRREPPPMTPLEETAALDPGVASGEMDGPASVRPGY